MQGVKGVLYAGWMLSNRWERTKVNGVFTDLCANWFHSVRPFKRWPGVIFNSFRLSFPIFLVSFPSHERALGKERLLPLYQAIDVIIKSCMRNCTEELVIKWKNLIYLIDCYSSTDSRGFIVFFFLFVFSVLAPFVSCDRESWNSPTLILHIAYVFI